MKILMILDHEFPPDIRVENEIASLHNAGHEVHVACYTRKGRDPLEEKSDCIIHRRKISTFIYKSSVACLKLPFYFLFWRNFVKEILSCYSFDAVHVHDLPLAQIGYEVKVQYGAKFILDLHENWPDYLKNATHANTFLGKLLSSYKQWKRYEKNLCDQADSVIVVIDEAKERLVKNGIRAESISVVSNTLNLTSFTQHKFTPDKEYFTLFYAGGIDFQRGLQTVIQAFKDLHHKKIRLWIFGDGKYGSVLKKLVDKYKVEEMVTFWGFMPFKEMTNYMLQADAAIIPHLKNDFTDTTIPHKLFQYMYAGLPVLSSDCLPLKRIIEETKAGSIFPGGDPHSLAKLIERLYEERNRNTFDPEISRSWVLKKYNWEMEAVKLLNIYA